VIRYGDKRFTHDDAEMVRTAIAGAIGGGEAAARAGNYGLGIAGAVSIMLEHADYPGGVEQFRNGVMFDPDMAPPDAKAVMIAHYESFQSHEAFVSSFAERAAHALAGWADRLRQNPPSEDERRALA